MYHPHLTTFQIITFGTWITFVAIIGTKYLYEYMQGMHTLDTFGDKCKIAAVCFLAFYWLLGCFGIIQF